MSVIPVISGQQYETFCILMTKRERGDETQILEFPIFFLANSLHTPYSTLYLSTISKLAKWTIANGLLASPQGARFSAIREKSPSC